MSSMNKINLKSICKYKYLFLETLLILIIFLSRSLFLGADLPTIHGTDVEIEEKPGGFNARNMIFYNRWPLYRNWFQPMVYVPLQNFIAYLTFQFFGVGLTQFRFPFALAGLLGLIFFYLILLKQTNRLFALFGLLFYAFIFEMTVWNRSALTENLYLLFMPLSVYFLTKEHLQNKDIILVVFFAALNIVVKLDGYPFYLAMIFFLFLWSLASRSLGKTLKAIILGSLAALAVLLALFAFTGCFHNVIPMYRYYFAVYGPMASSILSRMILSFRELIALLIRIDPYLLLALLTTFPVLLINYSRLNKTDWFMIIFFSITVITRLQIIYYLVSYKRVIFLFFPVCYLIFRSLFLLWESKKDFFNPSKITRKIVSALAIISVPCPLAVLVLFSDKFITAFYNSRASFGYISLITLGISSFYAVLFSNRNQKIERILVSLILFFVLTSVVTNSLKVLRTFLPENIKYSYQENEKYARLIPEEEMIISHEQGVRAFIYLGKHEFYYNHDGGGDPLPDREILERRDLRYFILNMQDFEGKLWGIPTKVRLELIKEAYPDLKLLDVFLASKIPLAIYDKYGNR